MCGAQKFCFAVEELNKEHRLKKAGKFIPAEPHGGSKPWYGADIDAQLLNLIQVCTYLLEVFHLFFTGIA
jgi:hypothetical protein